MVFSILDGYKEEKNNLIDWQITSAEDFRATLEAKLKPLLRSQYVTSPGTAEAEKNTKLLTSYTPFFGYTRKWRHN